MLKTDVVFRASKPSTNEEMATKCSIYYELLHEIPTEHLQAVFKVAKTKELHFPRPQTILKHWEAVKASNTAWANAENQRLKKQAMDGDELATDEEHKACMRIIMGVCDGKIDVPRGQELMRQTFNGVITG